MEYDVEVVCERKGGIIGRVKKAKIGWEIRDSKGKKVGKITDIFGPVSRPYVRIKMSRKYTGKITAGGDAKWQRRRKRRSG